MSQLLLALADLVAISVLTFGLYHRRHHRRDLVVALLGINVGVLGVSLALTSSEVSAGLGLGLFGVLSIIRLRSSELEQHEVAYYFVSLALGLLGGIVVAPAWLGIAVMAAMIGAIWVGDHPKLFPGSRTERVLLDRAHTDEGELRTRLTDLFDADVRSVRVRKVDLVRDTTDVEVRMVRRPAGSPRPEGLVGPSAMVGALDNHDVLRVPARG